MTDPAEIAKKLTPAQVWTLRAINRRPDMSMAEIGEQMRKRPGSSHGGGHYARDRQGLGMVGSLMLGRLEALGLAERHFDNDAHQSRIRILGRAVLAALDAKEST